MKEDISTILGNYIVCVSEEVNGELRSCSVSYNQAATELNNYFRSQLDSAREEERNKIKLNMKKKHCQCYCFCPEVRALRFCDDCLKYCQQPGKDIDVPTKQLELDIRKKPWTPTQWRESKDPINRLIWFINNLSLWNLWRARGEVRRLLDEQEKKIKNNIAVKVLPALIVDEEEDINDWYRNLQLIVKEALSTKCKEGKE